ncbi:hypothetical protein ACOMHN_048947 [Nucella lapillus]
MLLLLLLSSCILSADALNNGLALTPPMGWFSWERFRCETDCITFPDTCISENLYIAMADRMVADGYKDAGYEYVHIDDCWMAPERDNDGSLQADPQRFPSGIKALADYMHERGLKLGIYTAIGYLTCQKLPASEFHLERDANTFAQWGVDMVKTDICYADYSSVDIAYSTFGFFLNKTGRPMVYGCSWPLLPASTRPGGFADPDQIIVGNFGLSHSQQRVQFGMWAMLTAPLLMSVDLRTIPPQSRDLLLNTHVITINQDPLGAQGIMLYTLPNSISVWRKPLAVAGSYAIAILNQDDHGKPTSFSLQLGDIGLTHADGYNVTDLFDAVSRGRYLPSDDLKSLTPQELCSSKPFLFDTVWCVGCGGVMLVNCDNRALILL